MNSSGALSFEDAVARCVAFLAIPGFRVLSVDGRSGAGKTRFAAAVSQHMKSHSPMTPHDTLHLDDLYQGWEGLHSGIALAQGLVGELAEGKSVTYTPFQWPGMTPPEQRTLRPDCPLIIEGVGSALVAEQLNVNLTVWIEAPRNLRKTRALQRDGATYEPYWDVWEQQEGALFSAPYPKSTLYVKT